jgi:hypothetical protein
VVSITRALLAIVILLGGMKSRAAEPCEGVGLRQSTAPSALPGEALDYRIEIHNSGLCSLRSLEVTDYLPQEAEWIEGLPLPDRVVLPGGESADPLPVNRASWVISALDPGASLSLVIRVRVPEMKKGWMRNTVCISGGQLSRKCSTIETFVR